jgi:hypothetical protein
MDSSPTPTTRYRCTACGNLTRFEVTTTRRTRAFHHYTIGGELTVEEPEVLEQDIESVVCRWCGTSASVVRIEPDGLATDGGSAQEEAASPVGDGSGA